MAFREWKNHKYIRKEGNRYIYPEDLKSGSGRRQSLTRLLSDANKEMSKRTGATGAALYDHGGNTRRDNMDIALMEEKGVDPSRYSKKEQRRAYRNWVVKGAAAEKEERIQQQKAKEDRQASNNKRRSGNGVNQNAKHDLNRYMEKSESQKKRANTRNEFAVNRGKRATAQYQVKEFKARSNKSKARAVLNDFKAKSKSKATAVNLANRAQAIRLKAAAEKKRKENSLGNRAKKLIDSIIKKFKRK